MVPLPRVLVVVSASLVVMGCASRSVVKYGVTSEQSARDNLECRMISDGVPPSSGSLGLLGGIGAPPGFSTGFVQGYGIGAAMREERERGERWELCMRAKGYRAR